MNSDVYIHQQLVLRGLTKTALRDNVVLQPPQQSSQMTTLLERLQEAERSQADCNLPGRATSEPEHRNATQKIRVS